MSDESSAHSSEKFSLLVDLGIITVPEGYEHATWLTTFYAHSGKEFVYYNDAITDENFSSPSRILKSGDRLRVRAFQQIVFGTTTSEERMAYLVAQNCAVYTGAQGAALVFEQKRNQLPKGKEYVSFDEKERLVEDAGRRRRLPGVNAGSRGSFEFFLGHFVSVWGGRNAFFGFSDVE